LEGFNYTIQLVVFKDIRYTIDEIEFTTYRSPAAKAVLTLIDPTDEEIALYNPGIDVSIHAAVTGIYPIKYYNWTIFPEIGEEYIHN